MAMSIRNKIAEKLAREVADMANINMTQAIIEALQEKKRRLDINRGDTLGRLTEIREIGKRCAALPDLDTRAPEEILAYNQEGFFHGG